MMRKAISGLALAVLVAAGCSSSSTPSFNSTLSIAFNPMYSGYDGVHTYQIPATITNGNGAAAPTSVKWSASDSSMVDLAPASNGIDVMITTKKAGMVTIIATAGDAIGKAPLTIAGYTADQWTTGQTRYTAGTPTSLRMQLRNDGGADKYVQCTSCHGNAPGSPAIEHTPQQTGGFTDAELKGIFEMGQLPAADLMVPLFGGEAQFMSFHQWMVASDDEANGLIAYLRSLTPMAQGMIDFGGRGRGDGGMGFPRDAGATTD
jgi:hypothetical protein